MRLDGDEHGLADQLELRVALRRAQPPELAGHIADGGVGMARDQLLDVLLLVRQRRLGLAAEREVSGDVQCGP